MCRAQQQHAGFDPDAPRNDTVGIPETPSPTPNHYYKEFLGHRAIGIEAHSHAHSHNWSSVKCLGLMLR